MNVAYTSTLRSDLMQWLRQTARRNKTTKKKIITEALELYQAQEKQKQLASSFQAAKQDKAILSLTAFHDFSL